MFINLWVKDKSTGLIHQVGTDVHDSLELFGNRVEYYNLRNGCGTLEGDEYEWVEAPDLDDYVSVTPEQLYLNRELIHKDLFELVKGGE